MAKETANQTTTERLIEEGKRGVTNTQMLEALKSTRTIQRIGIYYLNSIPTFLFLRRNICRLNYGQRLLPSFKPYFLITPFKTRVKTG